MGLTILTILVMVALVGFYLLRRWVVRASMSALNQKVVQRGAHQSGQFHTTTVMHVRTTADTEAVLKAVRETVALPVGAQSVMIGDLYIDSADGRSIVFASGSRMGTSFRAVLTVDDVDGGSSGLYQVQSWHRVNGIVSGIKQMTYLRVKIGTAVRSLDPAAAIDGEREPATA